MGSGKDRPVRVVWWQVIDIPSERWMGAEVTRVGKGIEVKRWTCLGLITVSLCRTPPPGDWNSIGRRRDRGRGPITNSSPSPVFCISAFAMQLDRQTDVQPRDTRDQRLVRASIARPTRLPQTLTRHGTPYRPHRALSWSAGRLFPEFSPCIWSSSWASCRRSATDRTAAAACWPSRTTSRLFW